MLGGALRELRLLGRGLEAVRHRVLDQGLQDQTGNPEYGQVTEMRHIDAESILSGLKGQAELACKGPAEFAVWGIGISQPLDFQRKI